MLNKKALCFTVTFNRNYICNKRSMIPKKPIFSLILCTLCGDSAWVFKHVSSAAKLATTLVKFTTNLYQILKTLHILLHTQFFEGISFLNSQKLRSIGKECVFPGQTQTGIKCWLCFLVYFFCRSSDKLVILWDPVS